MSEGTPDTQATPALGLAPGTLILDGRFRVERLLGGGGMGLVYLAEQVSLGRKVAAKVLRAEVPSLNALGDRFRREALLLSSVEHPAVVRVIDFGSAQGQACLVMEFVEGESLEAVLRAPGGVPPERAWRLLLQLAQGLSAIHARGIVHRDLKPENVVVTRLPDGTEQARLLDFGIARLAEPGPEAGMTQAGFVLGTPEYLAPEQALGQPLDARADLYALGVLGYRLLAGRHPFTGPTPQEYMSQHIHVAPPPLLEVAPTLTAWPRVVEVVTACLAKAPAARPQTAQAVVEALGLSVSMPIPLVDTLTQAQRVGLVMLDAHGGLAMPPVAPTPVLAAAPAKGAKAAARAFARRHRVPLGAGVGVLVLAGALAFAMEPHRRVRRLLAEGRGPEALQVIDDAGAAALDWGMKQLKGAALHQVGRHDEEWVVVHALPDTEHPEPLAVEALADDYGHDEAPRLRKLLGELPRTHVLPVLQGLAKDGSGWAAWGALRYVDAEFAGQGLPLSALYVRALDSRECRTRALAAKRLGELRSPEAVAPLERLKALPRKKGFLADEECGQDAAAAALVRLKRELNP